MAILLREDDVKRTLEYGGVYEAIVNAFNQLHNNLASNTKRVRTSYHGSVLTYQAGGLDHYLGFKVFIKGSFMSMLFDENGELLLFSEADLLTRIRTGVISVIAADYLAKKGYSRVTIIGLGKQGQFQVRAFYELKKGLSIKVFSKEKMELEIRQLLKDGINVIKAKDYKDACKDADVIVTMTNSKDPFLKLEFLEKGVHINAMGSNLPERVELFPEVLKASSVIAVEDINQAKEEAGDLILADKMKMLDWEKVVPLSAVIGGIRGRKNEEEITIFKSLGIGLEDVAVMKVLYEKAKKLGLGTEIEVKGKWSQESEEK
ncbi:ornithine cyclodeaminase family protein [Stygiolobus caldivivus]|uniref:Ornithine cyclodeaminase n=1 Tax=Stygiolobus caldivivus TaxID=2824673 RepID=A0A8D5ZIM8_9CREN|nr:ornithine cyclodeaminase family protein [Stygiolobus caldivivus]BCU69407.1 ornithine cyclodeaminase [Stygiolobus caldivivus]